MANDVLYGCKYLWGMNATFVYFCTICKPTVIICELIYFPYKSALAISEMCDKAYSIGTGYQHIVLHVPICLTRYK